MSCKHEFVEAAIMVCKKCCKTMRVLEMEERLDAANANNKALREENELLRHKAAAHDTTMIRAELATANARILSYEQQLGEYAKGANNDIRYWRQRAAQAEAQNKRMRESLRRCGLCKDYSHEKAKCYHDYEGYRPPQATCDHPEAGFKLVDWAALEEKP